MLVLMHHGELYAPFVFYISRMYVWLTPLQERMNKNCGKKSFVLPPTLKSGNYLVRAEALALHTAGGLNGAQFYMSCYQVNVKGSGTQALPAGVKFPGAYKNTDPGILVDIYSDKGSYGKKNYVAPGPAVWTPGTSVTAAGPAKAPTECHPPGCPPRPEALTAKATGRPPKNRIDG
jgi:cellulase